MTVSMPEPAPAAPGASALACERCGQPPMAQWQRRLTDAELQVELDSERARREELYILRDVQLPDPDFGPMPTAADFVRAVFACGDHAISLEDAARVHQADCSGPHGDHDPHPQCTCEPEPLPEPTPMPEPVAPAHWR